MREQKNVKIVKQLYSAIERGDLPSALELLAEDVEWRSPVTRTESSEISWSRQRIGRRQVAEFFQELREKVHTEPFERLTFTAEADRVVVEGRNKGRINSTNRSYEHDWVMIFTLHNGKISRSWHYYDTADISAAFS